MTDVELPTPAAAGGGGFPDAISRILSHTGVPRPKRIKREKQEESKPIIPLTTPGAEPNNGEDGDGNSAEVKPNTTEKSAARRKHLSKEELDPWHVLPDVTEREKERKFTKIATRGVVQLFNAVRAQQSSLEQKLEEAGPSFRKSEQVLKSVSKGDFLDLLKNPTGSKNEKPSDDYVDEAAPERWAVLDDEYMTKKTFTGGSDDDGDADDSAESDSGGSLEEVF